VIVNAMTRMRFITRDGEIDLAYKGERDGAPANLIPWFEAKGGAAAIPHHLRSLVGAGPAPDRGHPAIDSGCLWGGSLTALRLEDRQVFSLPCPVYREVAA
jgi:bis(5'-nucleosyl)-tetraphosphatase (symmetrical)